MCKYFRNQPDLIWSLSLDSRRGSKLSLSDPKSGSSFGGRGLGPQWLGLTVLLWGLRGGHGPERRRTEFGVNYQEISLISTGHTEERIDTSTLFTRLARSELTARDIWVALPNLGWEFANRSIIPQNN